MKYNSQKNHIPHSALSGYAEGIKVENLSLNIFRNEDCGSMLVIRKYRFGIPVKKEKVAVKDCDEAEDRIDSLKCKYGVILKFRETARSIINNHLNRESM